ncbi:hypothetical protein BT63DRAFT_479453 [Microthyrium microscopicum]|uniref:Uncharacterized protein n=1 Tax=Microthyrium microscopicum TaxID=703497 RepID=A0A6A6UC01_9PEZI|nr:hypothetical protein BT63DRAFT_479453 [Microthyrium microscopicum]
MMFFGLIITLSAFLVAALPGASSTNDCGALTQAQARDVAAVIGRISGAVGDAVLPCGNYDVTNQAIRPNAGGFNDPSHITLSGASGQCMSLKEIYDKLTGAAAFSCPAGADPNTCRIATSLPAASGATLSICSA